MYAPKTLADCKQSISDRHDNGVIPTNSTILAKYVRLINRGVEYCADILRISKPVTLTVVSGVADLPADFIKVNSVFLSDIGYKLVDPEDETVHLGFVYWITGNQTDGFVFNTTTDSAFVVNYSFRPTWMSSDADVCLISDIEAPVAYAYAMLRKSESDPFEDSETALQECDSRLTKMQSANSINSDAIGFTLL